MESDEPKLIEEIHKIISNVWTLELMPIEWEEGAICLIYKKKGDIFECENYRGITLLNTAFKVLANILYKRLLPYTEKMIGSYINVDFKEGDQP